MAAYCGNYPGKRRFQMIGAVFCDILFSSLFTGPSAVGAWAYADWIFWKPAFWPIAGFLFFLIALVFFVFIFYRGFSRHRFARIVPYFQGRVNCKTWAFASGEALARHCKPIDALATGLGVRTISYFGFLDDQDFETVAWHDPQDGAATVEALISELQSEPSVLPEASAIRSDLEKIRAVLVAAGDTKFCFILRHGLDEWISPLEMDKREGRFA